MSRRLTPVAKAKQLCTGAMRIFQSNGVGLEFSDARFHLVFQSTVCTYVLDTNMKRQMAFEMCRVLKEHELILWHEFHTDNPRNSDLKGVSYGRSKISFRTVFNSLIRGLR